MLFNLKDIDGDTLRVHARDDGSVMFRAERGEAQGRVWVIATPADVATLRTVLEPYDPTAATAKGKQDAENVKTFQEGFQAGARHRADRIAEGLPVAEAVPTPNHTAALEAALLLGGQGDAEDIIRLAEYIQRTA